MKCWKSTSRWEWISGVKGLGSIEMLEVPWMLAIPKPKEVWPGSECLV